MILEPWFDLEPERFTESVLFCLLDATDLFRASVGGVDGRL